MVVKMKKWSPWHPAPAPAPPPAAAKFRVKVERIKLEGFEHGGGEKVMGVKVRWKGERKHGLAAVGFRRRWPEERRCTERIVRKGEVIEWEEEMENICCFSSDDDQHKFVPWDVSFKLTFGECNSSKMVVIGKVSLNLAEFASKMESSIFEKKLPIRLEVAGMTTQATISVVFSMIEITDSVGQLIDSSTQSEGTTRDEKGAEGKERKKQLSLEEVSLSDSDESVTFDSHIMSESVSRDIVKPDRKRRPGLFNWKRRRLNLIHAKMKGEDPQLAGSSYGDSMASGPIQKASDTWEASEFISRDGESKLKSHAFFASFDQCSDKAAGPSACTVLVTVIVHWLQSHGSTTMPTSQEFDRLIIDGSTEWRNLCQNKTHVTEFPDKHFDLETVLRAEIRPVSVSREKSSIGFFSPEKFECLKGAMSFDDIWDHEISQRQSQGIYIVSWNDHFFVLKTGEDGYYIIDTLGERLFEGCNRAYILKFDDSSYLKTSDEKGEVIYGGKECCKEFIKRFLVAIPLKELEIEEQKESVPYYSLHHRLQIEFNFCGVS